MEINRYINIIFPLIIFFFTLVNSQNIITSWHYDKVRMYELETLGDLFTDENMKDITFDDFTEDFITIKNLKISQVSHSLYDSYLNFKTGLLLLSPDKVSLSFTFDYQFQNIISNATFDFKINVIKIKIKNNKEQQAQNVNISGEYSETDFSVYDINDKIVSERVKHALYKGFKNNNIINGVILGRINIIEHYQKKLSKKSDFKLITSSFLDNKEIIISLNRFIAFCEDIKGQVTSALCYYSGEIDKEDKIDRSNAPLKNDDFINSTDTYNIFINMNLIIQMAQKIFSGGISEKIYDKTVPKKSLSYDFTVQSLKKYFNGLETYTDDLEFSTKIKIKEINTSTAKFNVAFNIGKTTNVFSIDIELNFGVDIPLKRNVRLNICLNKVSKLKVGISSGAVTIKDEVGLISAIQESFDFKNYPLCLSDEGVSFRDYYTKITKIKASEEGFYLFGNQLYQ